MDLRQNQVSSATSFCLWPLVLALACSCLVPAVHLWTYSSWLGAGRQNVEAVQQQRTGPQETTNGSQLDPPADAIEERQFRHRRLAVSGE
jgi:hypothetical protein